MVTSIKSELYRKAGRQRKYAVSHSGVRVEHGAVGRLSLTSEFNFE